MRLIGIKALMAFGLSMVVVSSPLFAQSSTVKKLIPVLALIRDEDECIEKINVGDTVFGAIDIKCPSAFALTNNSITSPASYYTFKHTGGPINIELSSSFPMSLDPAMVIRTGDRRDGPVHAVDNNGLDDAYSAWYSAFPLAPGTYTVEVLGYDGTTPSTKPNGAFRLAVYGETITAKASGKLNDTGVAFAGTSNTTNGGQGVGCVRTGSGPFQDCDYGSDIDGFTGYPDPSGGTLNSADGVGGFSFRKVGPNGHLFPAGANDHSCVKDNVTGLLWEVKAKSGGTRPMMQLNTWKYTWYDSSGSTPRGTQGGAAATCGLTSPARCDTESYVLAVNAAGLCGFNDWRLPTVHELISIANYNVSTGAAVDVNYFPNTDIIERYWSATATANSSSTSWSATFDAGLNGFGFFRDSLTSNPRAVRLVRSSP